MGSVYDETTLIEKALPNNNPSDVFTLQSLPMRFIELGNDEYLSAFSILLDGTHWAFNPESVCNRLTNGVSRCETAVDWGSGRGERTKFLVSKFKQVYAVEQSDIMCEATRQNAPGCVIMQGSVTSTELPEKVDFALFSHVLYYIPEDEWAQCVLQVAAPLKEDGTLAVVMKHPDSEGNNMMKHFGSRGWDLFSIEKEVKCHGEFTIEFITLPSHFVFSTLEDTVQVARFILSDRPVDSYTSFPTEEEFTTYIADKFWDEESKTGGWNEPEILAIIRRIGASPWNNPFESSSDLL